VFYRSEANIPLLVKQALTKIKNAQHKLIKPPELRSNKFLQFLKNNL